MQSVQTRLDRAASEALPLPLLCSRRVFFFWLPEASGGAARAERGALPHHTASNMPESAQPHESDGTHSVADDVGHDVEAQAKRMGPSWTQETDMDGVQMNRLKRDQPDGDDADRAKPDGTGAKMQKMAYGNLPSLGGHRCQLDLHKGLAIQPQEKPAKLKQTKAVPRRERSFWKEQLHEDIPVGMCKINVADIVRTLQGRYLQVGSSSRSIRVFISSTFTDTASERNILLQDVFAYLEEYARKHGYHFQASEMRWGIREHASRENMTAEMCLDEIRDCQASDGVNFVLLSTQKYGYQPLPRRISQSMFCELLTQACARESSALLTSCYRLDENALEPEYIFDAGHISPETWAQTEAQLREIIQNCAKRAWPGLDITNPKCSHPGNKNRIVFKVGT
jgi:hypothetical protein